MIGFVAAALTTFSFVPQVIHVVKSKNTKAISLGMYIMQVVGLTLWLAHGFIIWDMPLIVSNIVSILMASIVLIYKIKYK